MILHVDMVPTCSNSCRVLDMTGHLWSAAPNLQMSSGKKSLTQWQAAMGKCRHESGTCKSSPATSTWRGPDFLQRWPVDVHVSWLRNYKSTGARVSRPLWHPLFWGQPHACVAWWYSSMSRKLILAHDRKSIIAFFYNMERWICCFSCPTGIERGHLEVRVDPSWVIGTEELGFPIIKG